MRRAFDAAEKAERKKEEIEMKNKQKKFDEMRNWNKKLMEFKKNIIKEEAEEVKRDFDKAIEKQMKEREIELEKEKKILASSSIFGYMAIILFLFSK